MRSERHCCVVGRLGQAVGSNIGRRGLTLGRMLSHSTLELAGAATFKAYHRGGEECPSSWTTTLT